METQKIDTVPKSDRHSIATKAKPAIIAGLAEGNIIFKSVSNSRIYHFGSVTTRKNKKIIRNEGKKTFLLKWRLTVEFFTKHYLRRGNIYDGPLMSPKINLTYLIDYIISKTKYITYKFFK